MCWQCRRGREGLRLQQAGRACGAKADRACRGMSAALLEGVAEQAQRKAPAGPPARPRHVGRPRRGARPARRREARRSLPGPRPEQDLLGAGEGRAAEARGQDLDLAREGSDAGRRPHVARHGEKRGPITPSRTASSSRRPRPLLAGDGMLCLQYFSHQPCSSPPIGLHHRRFPAVQADTSWEFSGRRWRPTSAPAASSSSPMAASSTSAADAAAHAPELGAARLRGRRGRGRLRQQPAGEARPGST